MSDRFEEEAFQLLTRRYSERFRKVSNRYPRRVAAAYRGDLVRAMTDNDEQVAATVTVWEKGHGLKVTDWITLGKQGRRES
jgi:hypothetical protein